MRTLATVLVALVLVGPTTALALDGPSQPVTDDRFVVDTEALSDDQLTQGLEAADGEVLRTDEALSLAVLDLEDPEAFAEETGFTPQPDEEAIMAASTPLAEVPNDEYLALQWGPAELNAPQAWRITGPFVSPTVAVVDSGIDLDHPDIDEDNVVTGTDYIDGDDDPDDLNGHGTHVAGIVAAVRDNGEGVAGMVQGELFVNRIFDASGSGWCSDMASAIVEAVDEGVDVINLSGYCSIHYGPLHDALKYAQANDVVMAISAGNAQDDAPENCVRHPAIHAEAIAVAATEPTFETAPYSCQGPEVELAAPGSFVLSTVNHGRYAFYSGTSMAAPHVAATAAMLLDQDPSMTAGDVRDRMNETARDFGEEGHDEEYGHGMVDPVAALTGQPVWTGDVPSSLEG